MPEDQSSEPRSARPAPARGHRIWIAALVAFLLGLGAAGWLGWRSGANFSQFLGQPLGAAFDAQPPVTTLPPVAQRTSTPEASAVAGAQSGALAGRMAALEQRLDRFDQRMATASDNTARAEALLVAFAVRRVVERGAPLGYLADQLKLRFGDAQPDAVATIISGSKDFLPLDRLAARLETIAPQLTATGQQTAWHRVTRELTDLFVVRRDRPVVSDADARFEDARMALSEGRIDDAIGIIQHLSNGSDAANWSAAARRYRDMERALDLIDTTALLDPRPLHDVQ